MEFYPDLVDVPPIIDFEASSLDPHHSYPISVGIVAHGKAFYRVIRPKKEWTDWSMASESIHGLSKAYLLAESDPVDQVLSDIRDFLDDVDTVYSDAVAWDLSWSTRLGLRTLRVDSVYNLLSSNQVASFDDVLDECFRTLGLRRHCAIDDAVAIAHAVRELSEFYP